MELKDYLSSINHTKTPIMDNDELTIKSYPSYVVNKCMSYFSDTIFYANEMNCAPWLNSKSQFDFYRLGIRKKKRFSPWLRKETEENVNVIKQAFGYTNQKAREVLNILGSEDIAKIKKSLDTGGTR
jgi:hypothetical protein